MKYLSFNICCIVALCLLGLQFAFVLRGISRVEARIDELSSTRSTLYAAVHTTPSPPAVVVVETEEIAAAEEVEEGLVTEDTPPAVDIPPPSQVHLSVPFTSQAPEKNWEQPWQDACEEAAILMLDAYYKGYSLSPLFARDELQRQVDWQTAQGWGGSIDIVDVRTAAAWYMNTTEQEFTIVRYPDVQEMKQYLAAGHPILAVADGHVLPNPHFTSGGPAYHALVLIGYDDETGEFITNDPGTQYGQDFRYAYSDLLSSLRDWNGGDVPNGVPVVLVKD